ncbi:DUF3072 domain-containing protein [Aestuariibius sp. 2305UL40-4]|uniref:DUF3072 domain-containing protein n=1 Tax=Aestuariibius violaceus TaxID=3234132 RepID=UPI00345E1554
MIPPTKSVIDDPDAEAAESPDAEMTEKQAAELRKLCEQLDEPFDATLTEAQARERIIELRERADS